MADRVAAGETQVAVAADYGITGPALSYHLAKRGRLRRDLPIAHGTRKGYQQHRARGGYPCDECKAGNTAASREYAARQAAAA